MMDDKEIIKNFIDMGLQISTEALFLIKNNPELIIDKIKKSNSKPFIITKDYIKKILDSYDVENKKYELKTLKIFFQEPRPIKIEDYTKHFLSRYEKMKNIIENNLEKIISINKINENTINFSIIGIVKEKLTSSLIIEDPTGEIEILFEGLVKQKLQNIDVDDVIGIVCKKIGNKYHASKVVFPDIPLEREVKKTKENIKILVTNEELKSEDNTLIININKEDKPIIYETDNVKILLIPKVFFRNIDESINSEILEKILKKRHLYTKFSPIISFGEDNFLLDEIPDIVLSDLEPKMYKNYKGTTIISLPNNDTYFIVNLKTRDVEEVHKNTNP